MMPAAAATPNRVAWETIPETERRTLCTAIYSAAARFFENPENRARCDTWKASRETERRKNKV